MTSPSSIHDQQRFTWKIENFSSLCTNKLYSSTFSIGSNKWRMLLFPKGNNTNHLSMYLDVPDSAVLPYGWSRYAQFSLAVIDQIHNHNFVRKDHIKEHEFNSEGSDWGFTSFMPLSKLHDPSEGFLVNDTIIIEADFSGQSHDSKKETGHVELKNQGTEQRNEESQNPSQDNNSGNVEADITGISGGEVSLLEPVRQDVAPPVGKEANRVIGLSEVTPVGDTFAIIRAGVHASTVQASNNIRGHNILFNDASLDSEVQFLSYRVSSEAFLVLERIHNLHNDTFTKFSIKGSKLQTILLESFVSFIEAMSTIKVTDVNEDALHRAAISIEDFELVGLNLSWLKQKLDEAKRVNKHSESVNFVEFYESALQVAQAKVRKLEGGLANAKAELEIRSRNLPKSLGVDDYVLMDVA
ncbi:unnamed protein product [Camellia sinensis]